MAETHVSAEHTLSAPTPSFPPLAWAHVRLAPNAACVSITRHNPHTASPTRVCHSCMCEEDDCQNNYFIEGKRWSLTGAPLLEHLRLGSGVREGTRTPRSWTGLQGLHRARLGFPLGERLSRVTLASGAPDEWQEGLKSWGSRLPGSCPPLSSSSQP